MPSGVAVAEGVGVFTGVRVPRGAAVAPSFPVDGLMPPGWNGVGVAVADGSGVIRIPETDSGLAEDIAALGPLQEVRTSARATSIIVRRDNVFIVHSICVGLEIKRRSQAKSSRADGFRLKQGSRLPVQASVLAGSPV